MHTSSSEQKLSCLKFTIWILAWILSLSDARKSILVVGSINADTFLPVPRFPTEGENLMTNGHPEIDLPGGKGCTQAVAASKLLLSEDGSMVKFVGQFGHDSPKVFQEALKNVDCSYCEKHEHLTTGRGYVFLTESGSVSAVVSGGSNLEGWAKWKQLWKKRMQQENSKDDEGDDAINFDDIFTDVRCVMLQREVPEFVNLLVATEAKRRDILVLQDVGGDDRPISKRMLKLCDYLIPNETELKRLVNSFKQLEQQHVRNNNNNDDEKVSPSRTSSGDVVDHAKYLQSHGANNVLISLGKEGCILVTNDGAVLKRNAYQVKDVVDETGAGDCFRAAFAVALLEEDKSISDCMAFACAAGACAVRKKGAVPSTPTLKQVKEINKNENVGILSRGGQEFKDKEFPFLIGSRLNSMKDRPELWTKNSLKSPKDFVERQANISGLTCVDFNYPQHFEGYWSSDEAKQALTEAGLVAGAVCLRYPKEFARGAMNHPDLSMRRRAIDLTKEAAVVAKDLGCNEVVVWSAYDGYDYPFQVDYNEKWSQLVEAFRECCDEHPNIKFSVEFKPTDENTRFSTVPSTGAALLLVNEVDRPNFGLTLDVGHMLMAGENPGQSIAMAGPHLFGIQLNDGFTRLAAEDGLMFGSVHPSMALEIIFQLKQINFQGHFYFDTFPQRTDPIVEAEYNIHKLKYFWKAAGMLNLNELRKVTKEHDAVGALKLIDSVLKAVNTNSEVR